MSVHAGSNIVCLTNILHTTYITHYHIHCPLRIAIRNLVATMECSTVAGAGDAVSRNKGGTELVASTRTNVRLKMLPEAIGRIFPSFLLKAVNLAEKNN